MKKVSCTHGVKKNRVTLNTHLWPENIWFATEFKPLVDVSGTCMNEGSSYNLVRQISPDSKPLNMLYIEVSMVTEWTGWSKRILKMTVLACKL